MLVKTGNFHDCKFSGINFCSCAERWSVLYCPCSVFFKLGSDGKFNISKCSTSKLNVWEDVLDTLLQNERKSYWTAACVSMAPSKVCLQRNSTSQIEKENGCKKVLTPSGDNASTWVLLMIAYFSLFICYCWPFRQSALLYSVLILAWIL